MTDDETYLPVRADLLRLAERCERGAADLLHTAEHAAEILTTRAGGDQADPQEWAEQHRQAALVAQEYAAELRREVAAMQPFERPTGQRFAQAEAVARAAELGGILIDGSPMTERREISVWYDAAARQAERAYHRVKREAIEGSGCFTYVAETINGVRQVPYWRLDG
jgi:hypothetical protein